MGPFWRVGDCFRDCQGRIALRDILGPSMSLQPGTTLGPYRIVSQFGAGGMGVVYQPTDPRLKRTFRCWQRPDTET